MSKLKDLLPTTGFSPGKIQEPTFVATGVKPRRDPPAQRSGQHQDGFGGRTKRFQPSDYYETVSTANTRGNPVPYIATTDGRPMYHVAGNAGLEGMNKTGSMEGLASTWSGSVLGSANHVTPNMKPKPMKGRPQRSTSPLGYGKDIAKEDNEVRIMELKRLQESRSPSPGPDAYYPEKPYAHSKHAIIAGGVGNEEPLRAMPRGNMVHVLDREKEINMTLYKREMTPGPDVYSSANHQPFNKEAVSSSNSKLKVSTSKAGLHSHLAVGRTGRITTPMIRVPSLSLSITRGHLPPRGWRSRFPPAGGLVRPASVPPPARTPSPPPQPAASATPYGAANTGPGKYSTPASTPAAKPRTPIAMQTAPAATKPPSTPSARFPQVDPYERVSTPTNPAFSYTPLQQFAAASTRAELVAAESTGKLHPGVGPNNVEAMMAAHKALEAGRRRINWREVSNRPPQSPYSVPR